MSAEDKNSVTCEGCGVKECEECAADCSYQARRIREEDEEIDGWEEVCDVVEGVDDLIGDHPHLQRFTTDKNSITTYYQTYGGGPEGGYFVTREKPVCATGCGCEVTIYLVTRTWGEPFTISLLPSYTVEYEPADEAEGVPARIRVSTPLPTD